MTADFTDRDIDALQRLAEGRGVAKAAHQCGVTPGTYGNYLTSLYRKLGAVDKANAVHIAHLRGLLGGGS